MHCLCPPNSLIVISESSLRYPPMGISDLRNFKGITSGAYNRNPSFFLKQKLAKWIQIESYLLNHIHRTALKGPQHSICTMPLSIRQLTRTPLYLVLLQVPLNSANTRGSTEHLACRAGVILTSECSVFS